MLGNLINVCLFGDNIEKATEILVKLYKHQNEIIGVPEFQTISLLLDYCVENNNFNELLVSINFNKYFKLKKL